MPEFGDSFSELANDRKITHSELVRAIRYSIAAEYEAIQLYDQLAEFADNWLARKALLDIAGKETVHAGEFLRLWKELQPDEQDNYEKGAEEVEDMMAELRR